MAADLDMTQFHEIFFEEAQENLEAMESGLLGLNVNRPNMEIINTVFRAAHSIKGSAGTFGFRDLADLTHVLETSLGEVRDRRRGISRNLVDILLQSIDVLRYLIECAKSGTVPAKGRVQKIEKALTELPLEEGLPMADYPEPWWSIRFVPQRGLFHSGNDPYRLFRELKSLGELKVNVHEDMLPDLADMDPESCYLRWDLEQDVDVQHESICDVFAWVEDECELEIELVGDRRHRPAGEEEAEQAADTIELDASGKVSEQASIRVNIGKVDVLINLVGELVITQSILNRLSTDFDESRVDKLHTVVEQLDRNTRELQDMAMRIRMLPIEASFQRLKRLTRDLSQSLGKEVELKISGGSTEVDKTVLEKITDPLVHILRNSLDHGIESPEERRAAGKPERGQLQISASQEGGNITIRVQDDGAGLNRERIMTKARERNLVPESGELSDVEINDLIFEPGFSTAVQVSDVSGRGVGMDVVRRNITDLGGSVEVKSVGGQGCLFTIKLPLTLAILDAQLARVGREILVIPVLSIVESLQPGPDAVNRIGAGAEVFRFRGEYIPVVRLHEFFGIETEVRDLGAGLMVVVADVHRRIALFAEELVGQQQVVIKSLETNFAQIPGLSGATILGDGAVAMILDIPALILLSKSGRESRLSE